MNYARLTLHALNLAACALIAGTAVAHLGPQPSAPAPHTAPQAAPALPTHAFAPIPRPAPRPDALCLALNAYHEARGEGDRGMAAVSHVVVNRANAGYRGKRTVCEAVYDPNQFSWTHEDPAPPGPVEFAQVKELARGVLAGCYRDRVPGALHYYNPDKVKAWWAPAYAEVAVIGNHRFMK